MIIKEKPYSPGQVGVPGSLPPCAETLAGENGYPVVCWEPTSW